MPRSTFIEELADIFMVFLCGGVMAYFHYFIIPIPMHYQLIASAGLSVTLGAFGPRLFEFVEWLLFFCFGIFFAVCSPQLIYWAKTGHFPKKEMMISVINTIPYCLELLSVWTLMVPVGLIFYKISYSQRHYYRHARFF